MIEFREGDRVRLTFEGTVSRTGSNGFNLAYDDGSLGLFSRNPRGATVEVIEPEYEIGEVYRNAGGSYYVRTSDGKWRGLRTGSRVEHNRQFLPMTKMKLVPENA